MTQANIGTTAQRKKKSTQDKQPGTPQTKSPSDQTSCEKIRKSAKSKKKEVIPYKWLPNRIRELRKKLTLSQAKFATLLKVSSGTVTNWEQGYTIPTEISQRRLNRLRAKL